MRVAILYSGPISGDTGTSERVLQIANGLASLGTEVTFSGATENRVKTPSPTDLQVISMPNGILKLPSICMWIAKLVASGLTQKYDIAQIESFSMPRSLALFFLLRPLSRKLIIVFHDKYFERDPRKNAIGRFNLAFQKILLTLFDASITPGLSVKKWFEELHDGLANKMVVIPNGAPNFNVTKDTDHLNLREKHKIDPNAFIALFFGSMTFRPNYEAAMRLFDISNSLSADFEKTVGEKLNFIVAGISSEALPKTEHFTPLGFVKDFKELLSLPDVIVLPHTPSYSGPHVKTIYAFLSKKPVIATDDAVKDMPNVTSGEHFLSFDINKPLTLLNCLTELYNNRELRERLALNAYLYSKKFSWKSISLMHIKLYEQLLLSKKSESTPKITEF